MAARRFHQKRGSRPAAVVMVLVLIIGAVILLGGRVFVVRRIAVSGNQTAADREIVDQSGLRLGASIFSVDEQKVYKAFEQNGEIALEGVSIRWPDTVNLTVRERQGRAYVSYLGTALLVDGDCVLIRQLSALPSDSMPVVTGMNITSAVTGQVLRCGAAGQPEAVGQVLKALTRNEVADQVSELNVADLDNLYLITRAGMLVELGDENQMEDKVMWMKGVIGVLDGEGMVRGTLDVSSGKSAIYAP